MIDKSKLAVIHIAKEELKLHDDDYRYILQTNFKKDSSRDLNGFEFEKLMGIFEKLGWKKRNKSIKLSKKQLYIIEKYERELDWKDNPQRLTGFIKRQTGKDTKAEWLTGKEAVKVIQGLKILIERSKKIDESGTDDINSGDSKRQ